MFFIRSIGRLVFGNTQKIELLALENGILYKEVAQKKGPSKKTKIYAGCDLTINRTSQSFCYELVCQNKTAAKSLMKFAISSEMHLQKLNSQSTTSFRWNGKDSSTAYVYCVDQTISDLTTEMFHLSLCQCLFETQHRTSFSHATEQQIQELLFPGQEPSPAAQADSRLPENSQCIFVSDEGDLYLYDTERNVFVLQSEKVTAKIYKKESVFYLTAETETQQLHCQQIDPDMTQHADRAAVSYVWCYSNASAIWTFSLKLASVLGLLALSNKLGECMYEILNNNEAMDKDNREYLLGPFADAMEIDESPGNTASDESSEESSEEDTEKAAAGLDGQEKNKNLLVGYKDNKLFLSRGNKIGVFGTEKAKRLVFHGGAELAANGEQIMPEKMMLHDQDSSIVMTDRHKPHSLYRMDLHRGNVVEEWKVDDYKDILEIVPETKSAQKTQTQTLIGLSKNAVFRIDPRVAGNKIVSEATKQYQGKMGFTCGATTGAGELVLGTDKGDLKLYNKVGIKAKTNLPGFGDPVVGIDATENGRYIVATCRTYLLIIDTKLPHENTLGYTVGMGKNKPVPRRLQLLPEHAASLGAPISFTPAKFSTGAAEEKAIVTSTGPYIITWNFRRVKNGHLYDYQIKSCDDTVVAGNFKYGEDRSIAVALPDTLSIAGKQAFYSPAGRSYETRRKK